MCAVLSKKRFVSKAAPHLHSPGVKIPNLTGKMHVVNNLKRCAYKPAAISKHFMVDLHVMAMTFEVSLSYKRVAAVTVVFVILLLAPLSLLPHKF